jgi:hypothetical protein
MRGYVFLPPWHVSVFPIPIGPLDPQVFVGCLWKFSHSGSDDTFIVAIGATGAYISSNSGASFTVTTTGLTYIANISGSRVFTNGAVSVSSPPGGTKTVWLAAALCDATNACQYYVYFSTVAPYTTFTIMSPAEPTTTEGTHQVGLGSQADPNLALFADPVDPTVVYIGGTTQPVGGSGSFPNSIGATGYTARLFRGSRTANSWTPLTHSGTTSNSAPHADARGFAYDYASGNLVHTNDGGIYIKTLPRSTVEPKGDWFSVNGNLALAELLSASFHSPTNTLVMGAQDNGAIVTQPSETRGDGSTSGKVFMSGDGGYTYIDTTNPTAPRFFMTTQNLYGLSYALPTSIATCNNWYSACGTSNWYAFNASHPLGQNPTPFQPYLAQHATMSSLVMVCISTPVAACYNMTFPSSFVQLTSRSLDAYAFGGVAANEVPDANVIMGVRFNELYTRNTASAPNGVWATGKPWQVCATLAINPRDFNQALWSCDSLVYYTANFGSSHQDITGNLQAAAGFREASMLIFSTLIVPLPDNTVALIVGTSRGALVAFPPAVTTWMRVGTLAELPLTHVFKMEYDPSSDILTVATLGRSVYQMRTAAVVLQGYKTQTCPFPQVLRDLNPMPPQPPSNTVPTTPVAPSVGPVPAGMTPSGLCPALNGTCQATGSSNWNRWRTFNLTFDASGRTVATLLTNQCPSAAIAYGGISSTVSTIGHISCNTITVPVMGYTGSSLLLLLLVCYLHIYIYIYVCVNEFVSHSFNSSRNHRIAMIQYRLMILFSFSRPRSSCICSRTFACVKHVCHSGC